MPPTSSVDWETGQPDWFEASNADVSSASSCSPAVGRVPAASVGESRGLGRLASWAVTMSIVGRWCRRMDLCSDSSASPNGSASASVIGGVATLLLKIVWASLSVGLAASYWGCVKGVVSLESCTASSWRDLPLEERLCCEGPKTPDVSGVARKPALVFVRDGSPVWRRPAPCCDWVMERRSLSETDCRPDDLVWRAGTVLASWGTEVDDSAREGLACLVRRVSTSVGETEECRLERRRGCES